MRNVKVLFALLVVAVATVFIYSCAKDGSENLDEKKSDLVETRNEIGESCIPNIQTGLACQPGSIPNPIELPQYPGCYFFINASFIRCVEIFNGHEYIHFGDFSIIEHDCSQYNIDITNAINNGTIESFSASFNASVWLLLTNYLLSQNQNTNLNKTFEYVVASCVQTCIVMKKNGESGFPALIPVNNQCNVDCCIRTADYRRINGVWALVDQSITGDNTLCTPISTNSCPPHTISYTDCIKNCSQFIYF